MRIMKFSEFRASHTEHLVYWVKEKQSYLTDFIDAFLNTNNLVHEVSDNFVVLIVGFLRFFLDFSHDFSYKITVCEDILDT